MWILDRNEGDWDKTCYACRHVGAKWIWHIWRRARTWETFNRENEQMVIKWRLRKLPTGTCISGINTSEQQLKSNIVSVRRGQKCYVHVFAPYIGCIQVHEVGEDWRRDSNRATLVSYTNGCFDTNCCIIYDVQEKAAWVFAETVFQYLLEDVWVAMEQWIAKVTAFLESQAQGDIVGSLGKDITDSLKRLFNKVEYLPM